MALVFRPPDLPFVFDKFYRVKSTSEVGKAKGTGLGLAICKSIVEKYDGHIWADSLPGRGSAFTFALPLDFSQVATPTRAIPVNTLVS